MLHGSTIKSFVLILEFSQRQFVLAVAGAWDFWQEGMFVFVSLFLWTSSSRRLLSNEISHGKVNAEINMSEGFFNLTRLYFGS